VREAQVATLSTGGIVERLGRVLGGGTLAISLSAACLLTCGVTDAAGSTAPVPVGGPQLAGHGVIVNYTGGSGPIPPLPPVAASSFVVADAGTGQVLAAKDPHGLFRPASTLKVLTAVTLIPVLNPNGTVVASPRATSVEAMIAGLVTGQRYKIAELFTALLTISANDAAVALVEATGSYARGMAMLNAEAARLDARDTVAIDPNGLDAPGQHTSAYDLALFARQALTMPAFMHYDQTRVARFEVRPGHWETLYNQNGLLTGYPGGIGGKIGWTSAAGATYVGLARRHGVTLIVTLMHCPALTEIASAEKLLTWGFAVDGKVGPVGVLVRPAAAAASGATDSRPSPGAASASAVSRPGSRGTSSAVGAAMTGANGLHTQNAAAPGGQDAARIATVTAVGFTCLAVLVAGLGFAAARRQRSRRPR